MKRDCSICAELRAQEGTRLSTALSDTAVRNAVWRASQSFAVIPSVGPLARGHVLIVPFEHRTSVFAGLPGPGVDEISALVRQLSELVAVGEGDGHLLCFEHGAPGGCADRVLCSTVHAHLHVIPVCADRGRRISENLGGAEVESSGLEQISKAIQGFDEYVVSFRYGPSAGFTRPSVRKGTGLPSQFTRRVVAEEIGVPEWDWKSSPRPVTLRETIALGFSLNVAVM